MPDAQQIDITCPNPRCRHVSKLGLGSLDGDPNLLCSACGYDVTAEARKVLYVIRNYGTPDVSRAPARLEAEGLEESRHL